MLRKILSATPEAGYRVRLKYADGAMVVVDFAHLIRQGGVYAALAKPATFRKVSVSNDGRYIVWPGDIDFCADALWLEGRGKKSSATGRMGTVRDLTKAPKADARV